MCVCVCVCVGMLHFNQVTCDWIDGVITVLWLEQITTGNTLHPSAPPKESDSLKHSWADVIWVRMRLFGVTQKDLHRFQVYTWFDAWCPSAHLECFKLSSLVCPPKAALCLRLWWCALLDQLRQLISPASSAPSCEVYQHDQIKNTGFRLGFRLLPKVRDHGFKRNLRFSRNSLTFCKPIFFKGSDDQSFF